MTALSPASPSPPGLSARPGLSTRLRKGVTVTAVDDPPTGSSASVDHIITAGAA
jgi:hypothetical protein